MRFLGTVVVLAVALTVAGAAWADVVVLTNGDKVEGKILEEGSSAIRIITKYGEITISRRRIARIVKETEEHAEYRKKTEELAKEHVKLAQWCKEKGLEEEAKTHFETALELDPENADARKALGYVKRGAKWVKADSPEAKEEVLTEGQRVELHDKAIQRLRAKEYDEAEKILLRILKSFPKDATALYNLACTYSLTSKKEKAIEYLEKAIKTGFTDVSHIQKDTDLDNIREEEGYKKLIEDLLKKRKQGGML